MKKFLKVLLIIVGIIAALIVALVVFFIWASKQPQVKENYFESVVTDKPLEQKYTNKGTYEVSYVEYDAGSEKIGQFKIWYPTKMTSSDTTYPLVVMANGTGVPASKYEPIFDHLASWGFIVIGNEDGESWNGLSSAESLDFMLDSNKDTSSIFYGKIDTANIGIAGHSQGGIGAISAVTEHENGSYYKTIYTASAPHRELAAALKWEHDVSKINIPYFMTAGTLQVDAGNEKDSGIAPLSALQENYETLSDDIMKIYARRVNTDHGDMLTNADGYMTAWFMYHLKDDTEAGNVFIGEDAEILNNANWQDITKNH
ncbi:MAG: alpha/beta hydrolase [Eubacteriales bacterium]